MIAAAVVWSAIGLTTTTARGASVTSTAAIASAAVGQGDDFWEDRFNAMQRIWGTPYVPLGYYWDQARGLPPRPAPVAPGLYSDQPIYPYGGFGHGYGHDRGWRGGYHPGRGYSYAPGYGYGSGFGYETAYPYAYSTSYPYNYGSPYSYGYGSPYRSGVGIGFQIGIGSRGFPRYGSPYGGFYGW
jgi:hypothetical protein